MKEKVLIIRSVSFQQLDQNLAAIAKEFPPQSHELHLLTHGHGIERAETYHGLSLIIDYKRRENFTPFHLPRSLKKKGMEKNNAYEAVIVPVTNRTGLGFLNVLALAFRIPARRILVCNMVSELRPVSRTAIFMQGARSVLFSLLAGVGSVLMAIVFSPYLLIRLMVGKKADNTEKKDKIE